MEILVNSSTRVVVAFGDNLVTAAGQAVEPLSATEQLAFIAAIVQVVGDGSLTVSADHATMTVNPPSSAWTTAQTALATKSQQKTQHRSALAALYSTVAGSAGQITTDLTALQTIASALAVGTQPTAAQQLIIDRVYLRMLVLLLGKD